MSLPRNRRSVMGRRGCGAAPAGRGAFGGRRGLVTPLSGRPEQTPRGFSATSPDEHLSVAPAGSASGHRQAREPTSGGRGRRGHRRRGGASPRRHRDGGGANRRQRAASPTCFPWFFPSLCRAGLDTRTVRSRSRITRLTHQIDACAESMPVFSSGSYSAPANRANIVAPHFWRNLGTTPRSPRGRSGRCVDRGG